MTRLYVYDVPALLMWAGLTVFCAVVVGAAVLATVWLT